MLVDLTMRLGRQTPAYPGDPEVEISQVANLDSDGFLDHVIRCGTHNGTHIDAPGHMIRGGNMLGAYRPDRFVGRGRLLDLRSQRPPDVSSIEENDIVLLWTGFSEAAAAADYYSRIPAFSTELAEQLVGRGVKLVGVDAGSVDAEPFPIHKTLLGNDVLIAENLVGLSQLVNTEFEVIALPLNVNLDGSPARVVARVLGR